MLKVMLIDDEIMALNHMKTLVDWNSFGFEIVAAETSAIKGLQFLRREEVDVIFVDIKMPGMDGLEFSKKALEVNKNLEIIILTSYGDFDYAKKSLNIGVANYLLKHETKENNLAEELERIRKKLAENKQNDKVVLSQLLNKFISFPNKTSKEEKERIIRMLRIEKMNIICYLVVLDIPYPLYSSMGQYDTAEFEQESIENYMELNYDNMFAVYLSNGYWLVLSIFEPVISQRQILDETYMAAYGLQRYVYQQYGKTVSIIPSVVFNSIEELPDIYSSLRNVSKYLVFFDKNKILYGRDVNAKNKMEKTKVDLVITDIQGGLLKEDIELILKKIDMFFGTCIRNLDEKAFHYFCSKLVYILNYYVNENQITTIYEKSKGEVNTIFSASQIHGWFALQLETVVKAVKEKEFENYSPKIREAMKYILNNYHRDIKIEDVAGNVNVSGDYLRHIFKIEVGKGFLEYLTETRIERSKKLLAEDKYKLYEIASMVGYSSGTYFSAVFRKTTGMNPQDYKGEADER